MTLNSRNAPLVEIDRNRQVFRRPPEKIERRQTQTVSQKVTLVSRNLIKHILLGRGYIFLYYDVIYVKFVTILTKQ